MARNSYSKSAIPQEYITSAYPSHPPGFFLINHRPELDECAPTHYQNQIAALIQPEGTSSLIPQLDRPDVTAGRQDQVVFQIGTRPVKYQTNPLVNATILDRRKSWHVQAPSSRVVPNQVVRCRTQLVVSQQVISSTGSHHFQAQHGGRGCAVW